MAVQNFHIVKELDSSSGVRHMSDIVKRWEIMKKRQVIEQNTFTEFLLYTTPNGKVKVEILLKKGN